MGSAVHIHGEVIFDQKQGLWFMKDGWEEALRQPSTTDFFEWLEAQYNGLTPGQAPPPPEYCDFSVEESLAQTDLLLRQAAGPATAAPRRGAPWRS